MKDNKFNKKYLIVFLVGVFLISGAVSYAWFTSQTTATGEGNVTTSTTVVNANTSIETTGTLEFNDSDIYPGHKNVSTIKVVATGLDKVDYNVIWTGTNSFSTTLNYYVYKTTTEEAPSITCEKKTGLVNNVTTYYEECTNNNFGNLGSVVASGEITTLEESTKVELIKNESIQATNEGTTVYYHVVIEYPNKEEGQNADFNASINGEVSVEVNTDYAKKAILANRTISPMPEITGISSDTSNALYTVDDDDGTSYVFRGNPSNNWVQFGGFYWRIIRINGDGTIRMIYNGTSTTTGKGTQINETLYAYNTQYNDNAYVGFMYGVTRASTYEATHANTNSSNAKSQLDIWYENSGLINYVEYIDTNVGFCNDRSIGEQTMIGYGTLGYDKNATAYAPFSRFNISPDNPKSTHNPSLKCTNSWNDLFTVKGAIKGNKVLTNPVGLITADEVVYAGGFANAINTNYYLYTEQDYWTMSPYLLWADGRAGVFSVSLYGVLSSDIITTGKGIRPVINLRSDVTLTGSGLSTDPYKIEGAV